MTRLIHSFVLASCVLLAACGGGSGDDTAPSSLTPPPPPAPAPAPPPPPTIQFAGTYDGRSVGIAPLPGRDTIATRPVAKVEVSVSHAAPVVLTVPNETNAAGQPVYRFPVTPVGEPYPFGHCGIPVAFEITVTDVEGLAFTKYISTCSSQTFGGFSDWGPLTLEARAEGTLPMSMTFYRSGEGGYFDGGSSPVGRTSGSYTLNAREGSSARADVRWSPEAAGEISLTLQGSGGAVATSHGQHTQSIYWLRTELLCCKGTPAAADGSRASHQVVLGVAPGFTRRFGSEPPPRFEVAYRIFDPVTQTEVSRFTGTDAGYSEYWFDVKDGYVLTLEASPLASDAYTTIFVKHGRRGGDLSTLASADSLRVGVPARVNVSCCTAEVR